MSRSMRALLMLMLPHSAAMAAVDVESLVDPTRPLVIETSAAAGAGLLDSLTGARETYRLGSVLIRNQDRIAVINDRRVHVGDVVGAARVQRIDSNRVVLNQNGEQITLELRSGSIKTLVKQDGQ